MNFDPTQFEPVAIMTSIANVLLVRPDFPAKTPQEFVAYVKANPERSITPRKASAPPRT
jgi:tripartite-type tricarboxylate transporter receptor subunit TctC